jgi:RNA polymerase sigma factor (sigma-70 family)
MYKDINILITEYEPMINKFVHNWRISSYESDDLAQELRLVLITCNDKFDKSFNTAFSTFFYKSAENRLRNIAKQVSRRPNVAYSLNKLDNEGNEIVESLPAIEDAKIDVSDILEILEELPFGYITKEHMIDELSQRELSKKYNIPLSTVNYHHKSNIKFLKDLYKDAPRVV